MNRFWLIAVVAIAIAAPSAHAARHKTSKTETVSGTFVQQLNGNASGCPNIQFADFCGSGDCVCRIYDGTAAGPLGQGSATVYLDIDILDPTSSGQGCYPVYANVQFSNQTIGMVGALCGAAAKDSFPGGTLATTGNYFTATASAAGGVNGSVDMNANTVSLTLTPPKGRKQR